MARATRSRPTIPAAERSEPGVVPLVDVSELVDAQGFPWVMLDMGEAINIQALLQRSVGEADATDGDSEAMERWNRELATACSALEAVSRSLAEWEEVMREAHAEEHRRKAAAASGTQPGAGEEGTEASQG